MDELETDEIHSWLFKDLTRAEIALLNGYIVNSGNYEQDQVNLQYSMFITRTTFDKDRIRQTIHGNLDGLEDGEEVDNKLAIDRFFGLAGAEVVSYCGDREKFIGRYHGYGNPVGVINGDLGGALSYNENGCGALTTTLTLAARETKEMVSF